MPRADVTVRDGKGDVFKLTYWNESAVSEEAVRAAVAHESAEFLAAHPEAVLQSQLTVLDIELS